LLSFFALSLLHSYPSVPLSLHLICPYAQECVSFARTYPEGYTNKSKPLSHNNHHPRKDGEEDGEEEGEEFPHQLNIRHRLSEWILDIEIPFNAAFFGRYGVVDGPIQEDQSPVYQSTRSRPMLLEARGGGGGEGEGTCMGGMAIVHALGVGARELIRMTQQVLVCV
jgi:hypothetical protein